MFELAPNDMPNIFGKKWLRFELGKNDCTISLKVDLSNQSIYLKEKIGKWLKTPQKNFFHIEASLCFDQPSQMIFLILAKWYFMKYYWQYRRLGHYVAIGVFCMSGPKHIFDEVGGGDKWYELFLK